MHIHFFSKSYSLTVAKALRPSGGETELCPEKLPDILLLSNDPRPDAPYMLANTLWFHYHKSPNWAWSIWDNTFAALRVQVNAEASRDTRYATFLLHVDQHLPGGLDEHVAQWFQETGKAELISIDSIAWMSLTHTLLHLVVQGVLATTTILKGLVYPLWSHALASGTADCEVYLRAAHDIFTRLVLSGEDRDSDMVDLQRVRARRQDVFYAPHLSLLVGAIPTLVFLEHAQHVPADLRPRAAALRDAVCGSVEFRQGIYRDLNAVRDAFDKSLQYDALDESLVEPLMDALRLILNVARTGIRLCHETKLPDTPTDDDVTDTATIGSSEWLDTSALLSPWKLAATTIEVQFSLKQMGERLALGTPNRNTKVDRLIAKFMHHHMSTEEADLVAEMVRGVGPTIACKVVISASNSACGGANLMSSS
jgi:mediator of RNA polymerase II transcription subunit 12